MGLLSRRVSARRTLAVVAAVVALPWPVLVFASAVDDDPRLAAKLREAPGVVSVRVGD
jgi:hypothetical protein